MIGAVMFFVARPLIDPRSRCDQLVPGARFQCAGMTELVLPSRSAAEVVALWSVIHLSTAEQPKVLDLICRLLRPGGWFLGTVGATETDDTEDGWLGVEGATMYWSYPSWPVCRGWMQGRLFRVVEDEFVPEGEGGHQLVLARRQAPPGWPVFLPMGGRRAVHLDMAVPGGGDRMSVGRVDAYSEVGR